MVVYNVTASGDKKMAILSDKPACKLQRSVWSGQKLVDAHSRHQLWLKHHP